MTGPLPPLRHLADAPDVGALAGGGADAFQWAMAHRFALSRLSTTWKISSTKPSEAQKALS
jgi:hypothetical protein